MKKFVHYCSYQNIEEKLYEVIQNSKATAGKDRFTKRNLKNFFNDFNNLGFEKYSKYLKEGYKPRKYSILRTPKIDLVLNNRTMNGKMRIVCKPSIFDRPAFLILKDYLEDISDINYERNPKKIVERVKNNINRYHNDNNNENYYLIKADLSSFYSMINQKVLISELISKYKVEQEAICFIKNIFSTYNESFNYLKKEKDQLSSSTNFNEDDHKKEYFNFSLDINKGIPQGLPISNILGQMFIDNIEKHISQYLKNNLLDGHLMDIKVYRFVDDIVVMVRSRNNIKGYEIRDTLSKYEFKGLIFNPDKISYHKLDNPKSFNQIELFGFSITNAGYCTNRQCVEIKVNNEKLINYINNLEKMFSDFKKRYNKLKNNMIDSKKNKRDKIIVELIKFRNEIDWQITGYFYKEGKKLKGRGWSHYYQNVTNPSAFKLIDNMVEKFKKRNKGLENIKFKSALITYRYLHNDYVNKNLYIPNISLYENNTELLDEFLYRTVFIKHRKIKEMTQPQKIKQLNNYIYGTVAENLIDIERGKALYVNI